MTSTDPYQSLVKRVRHIGVYIGQPGLGDFLFIVPMFRALKKGFPDARVSFIGTIPSFVRPLFDNCQWIDDLVEYNYYGPKNSAGRLRQGLALRRHRFDLIVDTQRKIVPTLILMLSGAPYRVGYAMGGAVSQFHVDLSDRKTIHTTEQSLRLVRALGIPGVTSELECAVPPEYALWADNFIRENKLEGVPLLGMVSGSGIPIKNWSPENYARLTEIALDRFGARTILYGGILDVPILERIMSLSKAPIVQVPVSKDVSILHSAALMARNCAVVGNDSGPLHVADAVGVPAIGIYGPTRPYRFGLTGPNSLELTTNESCSPCSVASCDHVRCLNNITPDMVAAAAKRFCSRI